MRRLSRVLLLLGVLLPALAWGQALDRRDASLINPLEYGATCTSTTLNAAIGAAPATQRVLMLTTVTRAKAACTWSLTANVTVPATMTLHVPQGVAVSLGAGVTLTINGMLDAGPYSIFSGSGAVTFGAGHRTARIYPQWWGAIGDNSTNSQAAIQAALNAASNGGTIYFLPGTYLVGSPVTTASSNLVVEGASWNAIVKASAGFAASNNRGVLSFGFSAPATAAAVSNVVVRSLRLDGNDLAKPLELNQCSQCAVRGIQAVNAGPTHGIIYTTDTTDLVIEGNYASGALGMFGDGIYVGGGVRPRIIGNTVSDVTRLGIVTESGSAGAKSTNVYIAGNTIRDAHNATGSEYNGGIWSENTCGAVITGNVIEDVTDTPGAQPSVGIVLSLGSGGACQWQVSSNDISGAQRGVWISASSADSVRLHDTSVSRGTLANYDYGVVISQAFEIMITALRLGGNDFSSGAKSGVIVDTTGLATINSLTIADSQTNPTSAYGADSATLLIFNLGGSLTRLTLHNLQDWYVQMGAQPTTVLISDSTLLYREDSALSAKYVIQGTNVTVTNSTLTRNTGAGSNERVFKAIADGIYRFQNVHFVDLLQNWDHTGANKATVILDQCLFTSTNQQTFGGAFNVSVRNSAFHNNTAWGAIHANQRNAAMDLMVSDSTFVNTTVGNTPIVLGNFAVTNVRLWNNVHGTTVLTNMTTAVEVTHQVIVHGNLGTRGNGSMVFCSDCTATSSPCTSGGTGAIAMRLNGAWACQ